MDSQHFSMLPKILNGGIAGVVGVTCVFPIDLCKTRIQKQQEAGGARLYRNIWDCFVKTYRSEGFRAMYKGLSVNALLITPEKSIKLVGNDFFRHYLKPNDGPITIGREMLAGGLAGTLQIVVTTPMEMLKIQMQDAGRVANLDASKSPASSAAHNNASASGRPQQQAGNTARFSTTVNLASQSSASSSAIKSKSATQIAIELLRQKGIRGLFQGYTATFLRDVTFSIVYFPLFAHLNAMGKRRENSNEAVFYVTLIAGLGAGCFGGWIVTPMDVVKTRLQTMQKAQAERAYSGVYDCFKSTLVEEGPRALFKGAFARVLVVAPLFAIAQTVYFLGIAEKMCDAVGIKHSKSPAH